MSSPRRVLIGLVGEAPIVEAFPLGPRLRARLLCTAWPEGVEVDVEGMNWGALHVVQGLEGRRGEHEQVVLVACTPGGGAPGSLRLGSWTHETLPPAALQERIFEAVTGIVSLDNLLVIGEHFGVWPARVRTVEVQAPAALFGTMVSLLAQAKELGSGEPQWAGVVGFDPDAVLLAVHEAVQRAVGGGIDTPWRPRGIASLAPLEPWHIVTPAEPRAAFGQPTMPS